VRIFKLLVLMFSVVELVSVNLAQVPAAGPPTVTFTTLTDFGEGDGQYPTPLAQGTDGNFYGATYYGHRSSVTTPGGC
jgi:hypothetical protein